MASILQLLHLTIPQYGYATVFDHRYLSSHPSVSRGRRPSLIYAATAPSFTGKFMPPRNGALNVGDFMTRKDELHVVKPTTTVDEALEALVKHRISGFPVIDDDWNLVGLVSDYDLLALDSVSGSTLSDTNMFPAVDSTWKTFNEAQKLLSKTNGKVVGDLMTPAPLVVRENTNLEDAARLLLETKYRRLPVVDSKGKLVYFSGETIRRTTNLTPVRIQGQTRVLYFSPIGASGGIRT